jgi:hypothetical protein
MAIPRTKTTIAMGIENFRNVANPNMSGMYQVPAPSNRPALEPCGADREFCPRAIEFGGSLSNFSREQVGWESRIDGDSHCAYSARLRRSGEVIISQN